MSKITPLSFIDPNVSAMVVTIIGNYGSDMSRTDIAMHLRAADWQPAIIADHLDDVCERIADFHRTWVDMAKRSA